MENLSELIRLAKIVAKPYAIAMWVFFILLLVSVGANVYQAIDGVEVIVDSDNNFVEADNNIVNNATNR